MNIKHATATRDGKPKTICSTKHSVYAIDKGNKADVKSLLRLTLTDTNKGHMLPKDFET